ncbi:hypothetical protein D3C78_1866350 [compost metagenome]
MNRVANEAASAMYWFWIGSASVRPAIVAVVMDAIIAGAIALDCSFQPNCSLCDI